MNPTGPNVPLRILHNDPQQTAAEPEQARLQTSWTADELMAAEFPEPRWAVPGLIPEGVSLLAGPPKVGKSWLILGIALAVAAGGRALSGIDVEPGDVLYLALEDTPRRLQHRMGKILAGQPAPLRLTLATSCPTLPQGGADAIAGWLDRHRDARMVILDVFARLRGHTAPGVSAYDADYATVTRIKQIADRHGVAVVAVHHVRKAAADDFLTEVSGTNGLAGAADTTLVLKRPRGTADGHLHVTGRDVDETEYALDFQPAAGSWHLLDGPPEEHTLPDTRAAILRYLRGQPGTAPKAIAAGTGLAYSNVKQTCTRMANDGQLAADSAGRYRPAGASDPGQETVTRVTGVTQPPLTRQNAGDSHPTAPVTDVTRKEATAPNDAAPATATKHTAGTASPNQPLTGGAPPA